MEMNKEEREKTEALHQEIITALQWHLKQTTGAVSFARGNIRYQS